MNGHIGSPITHGEALSVDTVTRCAIMQFRYVLSTPDRSIKIIPANPKRTYFAAQNQSLNTIYVGFGSSTQGDIGWQIGPGGFYEPAAVPINDIYIGISSQGAAANSAVFLLEGTNNAS